MQCVDGLSDIILQIDRHTNIDFCQLFKNL